MAYAMRPLPELRTLRRTLVYWRKEILAYFYCRLTNARTEGFNGKAKLVTRRAANIMRSGFKALRGGSGALGRSRPP
jgi:hypothetical protein